MVVTREQIEKIADDLIGTCIDSLDGQLELIGADIDDVSFELLEVFDGICIRCANCGWWVSTDDTDTANGELFCYECIVDEECGDE